MSRMVEMDKPRSFKYGMLGISFIEKKIGKPIGKINFDECTMEQIAIVIQGGLIHEDADVGKKTPDDIMRMIDTKGNQSDVMAAVFGAMQDMQSNQAPKNA